MTSKKFLKKEELYSYIPKSSGSVRLKNGEESKYKRNKRKKIQKLQRNNKKEKFEH